MAYGDNISRQAAIDAFDGVKVDEENCTEYDIGYNDGIDFAISKLSVLPPAQPETATVTIGRTKGSVTMWYECDACGEPIDQNDCYCRKCGRKLKHE